MTIAGSYFYLGEYSRAGRIYEQAARLAPADPFAEGGMANALAQISGSAASEEARAAYARARILAEDALDSAEGDTQTMLALAFYCATLGDLPCAEQQQLRAAKAGLTTDKEYYWSALVKAQLGDLEAASAAAQDALDRGYPQALLLSDPLLARVWSQYRFATVRTMPFQAANY
jgi:tetratricopeptide (TPR) repeat protein